MFPNKNEISIFDIKVNKFETIGGKTNDSFNKRQDKFIINDAFG